MAMHTAKAEGIIAQQHFSGLHCFAARHAETEFTVKICGLYRFMGMRFNTRTQPYAYRNILFTHTLGY